MAIIAVLVGLAPAFPEDDEIYAYAIGVLVGTVIQLAICLWDLRNTPYGLRRALLAPFQGHLREALRDVDVRRVLPLMLPVTISLGLINFNLLINSTAGFLVSEQAPAAIDKAFRIYMLPQGIFSVAVATVLFPTLARFAARGDLDRLRSTMANGMRLILLLLIPATAAILVLAEPMIRLVYERGDFAPGRDRPGLRGALLVRLLAPVQRHLPAAHADLLQPPAALGADRDRRRQPGDHRGRRVRALRAVRGRRDRRRDRDRDRGQRRRAGGDPAPGARSARARPAALDDGPGAVAASAALAAVSFGVWDAARRRSSGGVWRARSSRSGIALAAGAAVYAAAITAAADPRGGADLGAAAAWRWRCGDEAEPEAAGEPDEDRLEADEELEEDEWLEEDDGEPLEDEPLDEEPFDEAGEHPVDGPATVLVIESGDRAGEEFAIERPRTTIGRTPDADIFLDDLTRLARACGRGSRPSTATTCDDLDSRNGTFVNRRRIAAHLLEHGDEIQIGRITLRYLEPLTQALLQANDV